MNSFGRKIKLLLTNKYIVTLLAFGVYITFFDTNSLIDRMHTRRKIVDLQKEIAFYKQNIETDRAKLEALDSSLENLEKFARETYLMHKPNEEIFIINE
ncbi:MAG: septum formation initiator family protein [Paludibacteraceae bacterium]